jgi:hypothetical protein
MGAVFDPVQDADEFNTQFFRFAANNQQYNVL